MVFADVPQSRYNCAGLGLNCIDSENGWCADSKVPCDNDTYVDNCVDDIPHFCNIDYILTTPRCSDFGLTCQTREEYPRVNCVGAGPECNVYPPTTGGVDYRSGIACENTTTLRTCMGGREHLLDCSTLGVGFSCIDGTPPYCGFAAECDPFDPVHYKYPASTCEGDSVVICNAGRMEKIDCKSLGFKRCNPESGFCTEL
ncbi:hypothetical protein [Polyangium jinanense]|nr:hypothetical protein [Polyangium jinanense]